ncbi:acyltransferase family protein [Flammeovirga yaeyamensis]|uniref:Acyltransferase family protein n=1 Tax=Flammeovirga yaeyamensis TaxID=367791 RepID=A0AAX1MZ75_9BACT|nr:acyltransferase [Flammeovirga yaeyamensis]MBB3695946.1 peptidoglycan/LPS O-acetylase OafA/YrhL [Flammeovirga yaeyamensis]NMF34634.1 acyltransferase [Flammeovirga yaeyamensis]QWG00537.1 acyltransferase family protein [Flammeovirga yaeyamensis]
MKPTNYLTSLTPLRGIAALWVIIFHIDVSTYYRDLGSLFDRSSTGIFSKGYLWVDFFFLLSGFIIYHVYGQEFKEGFSFLKMKRFLWTRFNRLYPLHLFTLMVTIIGALVFGQLYPQLIDGSWELYFSPKALLPEFTMMNAMNFYHFLSWNMPSWSIGAEFWTYFITIFILGALGKQNEVGWIISSVVSFSLLVMLVHFHPNHNLDITWDFGWVRCLFQFILGVNIYQLFDKKIGASFLSKDIVFIVLMVSIGIGFHFMWNDLIFVPLFALLLLATAYNNNKVSALLESPSLKFLGDISYSLYLMHGLVFFFFWFQFPIWKAQFGWETLPQWMHLLYMITFIGITILISNWSYKYIEVKGRKWLRK